MQRYRLDYFSSNRGNLKKVKEGGKFSVSNSGDLMGHWEVGMPRGNQTRETFVEASDKVDIGLGRAGTQGAQAPRRTKASLRKKAREQGNGERQDSNDRQGGMGLFGTENWFSEGEGNGADINVAMEVSTVA